MNKLRISINYFHDISKYHLGNIDIQFGLLRLPLAIHKHAWIRTFAFIHIFCGNLPGQQQDTISVIGQIDSLIVLNKQFTAKANYDEAIRVIVEAEKLSSKALNANHPRHASCLFFHGRTQYLFGHLDDAETLYLKALEIRKNTLGILHPDYAWSLNNLGGLYWQKGDYNAAETYYLDACTTRKNIFGTQHPDYAWSLHNLGILYVDMGYYEKAESLYLQAMAIRSVTPGKQSVDYAYSLNHLAILYRNMGNYERSEKLHLEAMDVFLKTRGKDHPDYAWNQGNLASLYKLLGNYDKAENCLKEVIRIREQTLGKKHADYASALISIAEILEYKGEINKAEIAYQEALVIRETIFGKEHQEYANCLSGLARFYQDQKEYDKAESFWLNCLNIEEHLKDKQHLNYLLTLSELGYFYLATGNLDKAGLFLKKAEQLFRNTFGNLHPELSKCLDGLTEFEVRKGNAKAAAEYAKQSALIYKKQLLQATNHLSEYELQLFIRQFESKLNDDNLLTQLYPDYSEVAMDNMLFYKSYLLSTLRQLNAEAKKDSVTSSLVNNVKSIKRRLSKEYAKSISEQKGVKDLEEKANTLEKELAQHVHLEFNMNAEIHWSELKEKLDSNAAVIEFVHFQNRYLDTSNKVYYAALVVKRNYARPHFVLLFEEKSIDSLLTIGIERQADYVNALYSVNQRGARLLETRKRSLAELIFQPLQPELQGIQTIYYAPTGLLYRINLDAIPLSETEVLADRYRCVTLNSTRQLLNPLRFKPESNDAILYGGIEFDCDRHADSTAINSREGQGNLISFQAPTALRGANWDYLPGTLREVEQIEGLMNKAGVSVKSLKGCDATEESFKLLESKPASPRILHFATHGYFFPDLNEDQFNIHYKNSNEPVFKTSDQPMLRSGLILANGNNTWKGHSGSNGKEDGILTADEISQMNLSNTELIVLSACETGLGHIDENEGVYGLQRAFKIAGAKYLIMSLWQVPDKQTSLLMNTFYTKWLGTEGPDKGGNKMEIPQAFHAAQKELRNAGLDPYQWAGFVLVE